MNRSEEPTVSFAARQHVQVPGRNQLAAREPSSCSSSHRQVSIGSTDAHGGLLIINCEYSRGCEEGIVLVRRRGVSVVSLVPQTSTGEVECLTAQLSNGHETDDLVPRTLAVDDASFDDVAQVFTHFAAFPCIVLFTV
jgi:hypothetical protein